MRPRTFEEFQGQGHLVGETGPLRRSVTRGHLTSLLLWGPPGTGKTTLARILAEAIKAEFTTPLAVMSGVAEVRAGIAAAQDRLALTGQRTVLFIDEIAARASAFGRADATLDLGRYVYQEHLVGDNGPLRKGLARGFPGGGAGRWPESAGFLRACLCSGGHPIAVGDAAWRDYSDQ